MNGFKFLIVLFISNCFFVMLHSQIENESITTSQQSRKINIFVYKDPRIDSFRNDIQWLNVKHFFSDVVPVYKLQIINTNNRMEAMEVKKDLELIIPELPGELSYREPYYKIKVGIFKNIPEAESYRARINKFYKNNRAIVIIPDYIPINTYMKIFYPNRNTIIYDKDKK